MSDFEMAGKCPSDQTVTGSHCFGRWVRGVPVFSGLVSITCKFCGISRSDWDDQEEEQE
jgi:hypothetical protein